MQIRDAIANFASHFRRQAALISEVSNPLFRQLLAATALDPLARAAYGKPKRHRNNLQRLVEELTSWDSRDRISVVQLRLRLAQLKRTRYKLHREATKIWQELPSPHVFPSTAISPTIADLLPLATEEQEIAALADSRYSALFCAHRNTLVHEFRPPGYGHDWSGRKTHAFYGPSAFSERELVFPPGFFEFILSEAISGVEQHLAFNQINPYEQFEFGSLWRYK